MKRPFQLANQVLVAVSDPGIFDFLLKSVNLHIFLNSFGKMESKIFTRNF